MKRFFEKLRNEDGFTLLEMAIVVLVITMLLLLVITNVDGVQGTVDKKTGEGIITTVETQKVLYEMDNNEDLPADEAEMLDTLLDKEYITGPQKDAYLKAKGNNVP